MKKQTKRDMKHLIEHWRSVIPKRAMTYGEHLAATREQAYEFRAFADEGKPALDLSWLVDQTAVPVSLVPSWAFGEDRDGYTTTKLSGSLEILINRNRPATRKRWTLLHEWKHALDFPDNGELYKRLGSGDRDVQTMQIEGIANHFAAQVLMPLELLKDVWFKTKSIRRTAEIFKVSMEAMRIRLEAVGLVGETDVMDWTTGFSRLAIPTQRSLSNTILLPCA